MIVVEIRGYRELGDIWCYRNKIHHAIAASKRVPVSSAQAGVGIARRDRLLRYGMRCRNR